MVWLVYFRWDGKQMLIYSYYGCSLRKLCVCNFCSFVLWGILRVCKIPFLPFHDCNKTIFFKYFILIILKGLFLIEISKCKKRLTLIWVRTTCKISLQSLKSRCSTTDLWWLKFVTKRKMLKLFLKFVFGWYFTMHLRQMTKQALFRFSTKLSRWHKFPLTYPTRIRRS